MGAKHDVYIKKLSGDVRKKLVAMASSKAPEGYQSWTMELLAEQLMELNFVDSISDETVRTTLQEENVKPWLTLQWVIPPKSNGDFVAAMEDVLEVYSRPLDPQRPVVCIDECSKQLTREVRQPIPGKPGSPEKYDSEYERNGTCNLFMISAPLIGWREVIVTDQRRKYEWAQCIKNVVYNHFAEAEKIVLVQDNLNTHKPGSLYEAFPAEEARRIVNKLEWHYTPKHGSWLDMAEIELAALQKQCLNRRLPDKETLCREVEAWKNKRNEKQVKTSWGFTIEQARKKLKHVYPNVQQN